MARNSLVVPLSRSGSSNMATAVGPTALNARQGALCLHATAPRTLWKARDHLHTAVLIWTSMTLKIFMCIMGKKRGNLLWGHTVSRGDSTLVTRVKGGTQHNLLAWRRLPGKSWPHHPVSNSLGSWEARMRKRELTPVLPSLGGLRGQSTLNLEGSVGLLKEQAQVSQSPSLRFL